MGIIGDTGSVAVSTGASAIERGASWGIKGLMVGAVAGAVLAGGAAAVGLALFSAALSPLGLIAIAGFALAGALAGGKAAGVAAGGIGGVVGAGQGIADGVKTVSQKRALETELARNQEVQNQIANSAQLQAAMENSAVSAQPKPEFDNPDARNDFAAQEALRRQQQAQQPQTGLQA